jgi:hypothetical protein
MDTMLENCESSSDKYIYENKIAERFDGPKERPHAICRPVVRNERGRQLTQTSVDGRPRAMTSAPPPLADIDRRSVMSEKGHDRDIAA